MGSNHEGTVRTPIVDRNGKQTTVHKKPAGSSPNSLLGKVAPTLGTAKAPKPYKPIKSQTERLVQNMSVSVSHIDDRIKVDTRHVNGAGRLDISCAMSDVAVYGVLSSVDNAHDAVALMQFGVGSAENAREALRRFDAEDLGADEERTALVQAAFERRIPATDFIAFEQSYAHHNDGTGKYLDAAEAYSKRSFRESSFSESAPHTMILSGRISLQDAKDVGAQNFVRAYCRGRLTTMLAELNEREDAPYTASHLGEVLKASEGKSSNENAGIRMLEKCGGDFIANVHDIGAAIEVAGRCGADGVKDWRGPIKYVDEFRFRRFRNLHEVYNLYKLGVDMEFAVEKSKEMDKYSVNDIAAMYAGVAPAMVDGWL